METTHSRMLDVAGEQFAEKGYSGTSMRSIANAVGTTQATIYHHFPNKEALYIAVLARHFKARTDKLPGELEKIADPEQRLRTLVQRLLQLVDGDKQFRQLYMRELLDGDSKRLRTLATSTFGQLADSFTRLLEELAPRLDPHLMLISVTGLVFHHLEARKLSPYLPGGKKQHQKLTVLAEHITDLLLQGVRSP